MKTLTEIKNLLFLQKKALKKDFNIKEISIFGSYAKGEQRSRSDLDLLVDFNKPVSLLKIVSLENYLKDVLKQKVDVVPKNNLRIELKNKILEEAIRI